MKLINVSQQHKDLIQSQLATTQALLVEVYTAGNTDVIFSQTTSHYELIISNDHRPVQSKELDSIRDFFFNRKVNPEQLDMSAVKTVYTDKLIEMSVPIKPN